LGLLSQHLLGRIFENANILYASFASQPPVKDWMEYLHLSEKYKKYIFKQKIFFFAVSDKNYEIIFI